LDRITLAPCATIGAHEDQLNQLTIAGRGASHHPMESTGASLHISAHPPCEAVRRSSDAATAH
jgi:hypothetical protein